VWEVMTMCAIGTSKDNRSAFTLIELILVMTIMVVVVGLVFPSLKGFFHAHNLDNDARQFLALTRYGQSRAIAEGLPVELWINPRLEQYGLQALSGYSESQTNSSVYSLDQTVQIFASQPSTQLTRSNLWTSTASTVSTAGLMKIRFQPDGFISDNSPENIYLRQPDVGGQIWIAENPTHRHYEIHTGPAPLFH
jgi:type II secretion system protein H